MENVTNIYNMEMGRSTAAVRSVTTEMAVSRQTQEVQAAMVIAKRFPRNEVESYGRIMNACKRKSLAEQAMYEYPRGGTKVTGPSIRLAEAMAQSWGNLDYGIIELEQRNGESQVMAYAWDLETNTRQTKIFTVPHIRSTKQGNIPLTDPRDIYELVANQGARRVRACILGVIPGDVIDSAIAQCNATLEGQCQGPLIDNIRQIANTFGEKFGVTIPMLEKYIGCQIESFSMNDLIRLKKVYQSLKDGMGKREDYFDIAPESLSESSEVINPFESKKQIKAGEMRGKSSAKGKSASQGKNTESAAVKGPDGTEKVNPDFIPDEPQDTPFR